MQERAFRIDPLLTLHFGPDCLTSGALFCLVVISIVVP